MALNTGVTVVQQSPSSLKLANDLPIAIFGTCSTGTITGVLTRIKSADEATTILGAGGGADTLPKAVGVLQRYGCGNIIACKITGADAGAQETDLIAKLDLLLSAIATIGEQPRLILFPTFTSDAVITKVLSVATSTLSVGIATFAAGTTVAAAISGRSGSTGLASKNERLIVCHGYLKNADTPATLEALELHLAGAIANLPYGRSPLNFGLLKVGGVDVAMMFGVDSDTSSPETLNDVGVMSVNLTPDARYVLWGSRNSKYAEASTDILTFINAIRARDEITQLAKIRATKMLGQASNFSTASLLTESYKTMLSDEITSGGIKSYSRVEINTTKTDYALFKIWHDLEFQVYLPTELIGVNIYLSLVN